VTTPTHHQAVFTADELNGTELNRSARLCIPAANQLRDADARVTNNASRNWVNLLQVSSVQFSSSAVNKALVFAGDFSVNHCCLVSPALDQSMCVMYMMCVVWAVFHVSVLLYEFHGI